MLQHACRRSGVGGCKRSGGCPGGWGRCGGPRLGPGRELWRDSKTAPKSPPTGHALAQGGVVSGLQLDVAKPPLEAGIARERPVHLGRDHLTAPHGPKGREALRQLLACCPCGDAAHPEPHHDAIHAR